MFWFTTFNQRSFFFWVSGLIVSTCYLLFSSAPFFTFLTFLLPHETTPKKQISSDCKRVAKKRKKIKISKMSRLDVRVCVCCFFLFFFYRNPFAKLLDFFFFRRDEELVKSFDTLGFTGV